MVVTEIDVGAAKTAIVFDYCVDDRPSAVKLVQGNGQDGM